MIEITPTWLWGVSHGKPLVLMTIVSCKKEGTDSRAAAGDTFKLPWMMMMTMKKMMIFYGGIGTKCTEHQIVTQNKDRNNDDDDDGNDDGYNRWPHEHPPMMEAKDGSNKRKPGSNRWHQRMEESTEMRTESTATHDGKDDDDGNLPPATSTSDGNNTNTNTNTNKNNKSPEDRSTMTMWEVTTPAVARLDQPDLLPPMMGMMATANGHNQRKHRLDGIHQWNPPMESTDGINRSWNRPMAPTAPSKRMTQRRQMEATNGHNGWLQHPMETTTGKMTMMGMMETPPATGTLDRKTSQAPPTACLYNQQKTLDD
jgi:hypothetical protein